MTKITTVIFDVDGTLTPQNSWTALTEALGSSASRHMKIYWQYSEGLLDDVSAKGQLLQLWGRTGRPTREALSDILRALPIRPEAHHIIQWLKDHNYNICLISGSMDLYVQLVAEMLGVPSYFANTKLFFNNRGELIDFDYFRDQSAKKVEQLNAYCNEHNIYPAEVATVGNSANDLGLFAYTKHGILLAETATQYLRDHSWRMIHSLLDIKGILQPECSKIGNQ